MWLADSSPSPQLEFLDVLNFALCFRRALRRTSIDVLRERRCRLYLHIFARRFGATHFSPVIFEECVLRGWRWRWSDWIFRSLAFRTTGCQFFKLAWGREAPRLPVLPKPNFGRSVIGPGLCIPKIRVSSSPEATTRPLSALSKPISASEYSTFTCIDISALFQLGNLASTSRLLETRRRAPLLIR